MKPWARRFILLLLFMAWLLVMSLPLLAVMVARNGQIQVGAQDSTNIRVFLVQEKDANGLGFAVSGPLGGENRCQKTAVRYLMWEGNGQSANYCECFDRQGNVTGSTCP